MIWRPTLRPYHQPRTTFPHRITAPRPACAAGPATIQRLVFCSVRTTVYPGTTGVGGYHYLLIFPLFFSSHFPRCCRRRRPARSPSPQLRGHRPSPASGCPGRPRAREHRGCVAVVCCSRPSGGPYFHGNSRFGWCWQSSGTRIFILLALSGPNRSPKGEAGWDGRGTGSPTPTSKPDRLSHHLFPCPVPPSRFRRVGDARRVRVGEVAGVCLWHDCVTPTPC